MRSRGGSISGRGRRSLIRFAAVSRERKRLVKKRDRLLDGRRNELAEVEPGVYKALAACTAEDFKRAAEIGEECERLVERIDGAIAKAVDNAPAGVMSLEQLGLTPELHEQMTSERQVSVLELRKLADDVDAALA